MYEVARGKQPAKEHVPTFQMPKPPRLDRRGSYSRYWKYREGAVRYRISIFMWFQLLPLPSIYAPIRPHLLALSLSPGLAPFPPGVCGVLFGKASSPFAFPTRLLVRVSHHLFPALEVNYLPTLKLLSLAEEATQ